MTYVSTALGRIQSMTVGRERDEHWNLFWHWYKHAQPLLARGRLVGPAEIRGVPDEDAYLAMARAICQAAARGEEGTEIKVREVDREGGTFWHEWLVWYQPRGLLEGVFLVVQVVGAQGQLKTMFPPDDGHDYFAAQDGIPVQ